MTVNEVNKMKKYIIALTLFATLLIGGCGGNTPTPTEPVSSNQELDRGGEPRVRSRRKHR